MKKLSTEHETGKIRTGDLELESGNCKRPANLREMLRFGEEYLTRRGIADAAVDAWLLLEYVTGLSRAQYLARAAEPLERICRAMRVKEPLERICGSVRVKEPPEHICRSVRVAGDSGLQEQKCSEDERKTGMEFCSAEEVVRDYSELLKRRGEHIPLQHLTGEQEFMGLPFLVNEHVLIPRQDTETLVEQALARLRPGMRVLDLCTGSGCIAVSLAKLGPEYMMQGAAADKETATDAQGKGRLADTLPTTSQGDRDSIRRKAVRGGGEGIHVDASDISPEALAVARENARRLGVQIRLIESDLFAGMAESNRTDTTNRTGEENAASENNRADGQSLTREDGGIGANAGRYDMIVSNPPYIRTRVIGELSEEVRLHEPLLALDGREDGLHFYREIVRRSPAHLTDGGWLLFEIGYDQAEAVSALMAEAGFTEIEVIRDLAGHDRVAVGRWIGRG